MSSFYTALKSLRTRALGLKAIQARLDYLEAKLKAAGLSEPENGGGEDSIEFSKASNTPTSLRENESIRIALVVQHPSVWPSWRHLWITARNDSRFSIKIILTRFIHPFSSESKTFDDMKRCLISEGVPFSVDSSYEPTAFRPHVTFLQNPYDETRPEKFQIDRLKRSGTRIAYIPYGLEIGGGTWNIRAQFDSPLHRSAWRIFARSERSKTMFGRYCQSGNDHVAVVGHPKFDEFRSDKQIAQNSKLVQKIANRKVILWTPHFSVGEPPTWSTFKEYGSSILEKMKNRQDLFLLIRPHPMFFRAMLQHKVWNEERLKEFKTMIDAANNFSLDEKVDYHPAFAVADALMADAGSFLLEFLPTGKPILYLHCRNGLGLNDDGEITKYVYPAFDQGAIDSFIELIAQGNDPLKAERLAAMPDYIFGLSLESTASERICEHILSSLRVGDEWSPRTETAKDAQIQSESYWKSATSTYLAPADYYDQKQLILGDVLSTLPRFNNVIDIGCGEGKFTFQLAEYADKVTGYDINPALSERGNSTAKERGLLNVQFIAQEIEDISPLARYDLVSCMGVTSCIIDDSKFLSVLDKLETLSANGGRLLLIDSLSTVHDQVVRDQSGYVAKYRSIDDYRELISRRGFILDTEILIKEVPEMHIVNKLFIFSINLKYFSPIN